MMSVEEQIDNAGILTVTLNRPEKLNALNAEVLANLSRIFNSAKENPRVRALILTGAGKAFCAGADIQQLANCTGETGYHFAKEGQAVCRLLETLGKPSLAAVNGAAFGGGCELAMSATFRIASKNAKFGQPEVKLGVIPGYGGTQRLARLVGKGRALDLCLTGRFISADTAMQWGLVSEVVDESALMDCAKSWQHSVLAMSPKAVAHVMDVIDRGYDLPLTEALHMEALHFATVCASADKEEGTAAFLAKRQPVFQGS